MVVSASVIEPISRITPAPVKPVTLVSELDADVALLDAEVADDAAAVALLAALVADVPADVAELDAAVA